MEVAASQGKNWFYRLIGAIVGGPDYGPEETALHHLSQAYLDLLRMPQGGVRARSQSVLAAARDAIAAELKDTPEKVQNFYEEWVRDPEETKRRIRELQ